MNEQLQPRERAIQILQALFEEGVTTDAICACLVIDHDISATTTAVRDLTAGRVLESQVGTFTNLLALASLAGNGITHTELIALTRLQDGEAVKKRQHQTWLRKACESIDELADTNPELLKVIEDIEDSAYEAIRAPIRTTVQKYDQDLSKDRILFLAEQTLTKYLVRYTQGDHSHESIVLEIPTADKHAKNFVVGLCFELETSLLKLSGTRNDLVNRLAGALKGTSFSEEIMTHYVSTLIDGIFSMMPADYAASVINAPDVE